MAFPTGYTKYQNITIDHTKVPGDLTDYIVYVNLADLVKAGADIFDLCRTDGGDIRATKTDGTTELAIEIVAIDTTAKTGEVHIKFSGTLSSSTDTVIRLWYNGSDTLPAVTATYGRNAVWSAYNAVWHFQDNRNDSSGNGWHIDTDLTGATTFTTGKVAKGLTLPSNHRAKTASTILNGSTADLRLSSWVRPQDTTRKDYAGEYGYILQKSSRTASRLETIAYYTGATVATDSSNYSTNVWYYTVAKTIYADKTAKYYKNGSLVTTSSAGSGARGTAYGFSIGGEWAGAWYNYSGSVDVDEMRLCSTLLSDNWETTEYNNQSSPSTFYATGNEVVSTTIISPSAQVATFTVPAYTIIRGVVLQATVQTATFSLPGDTVLTSVRVSPDAQLATFTIPAYGISASAVMFNAGVQVSTFTVPTYTVLRGSVFSPDGQTLTFTVPSPAIATGNTVSVEPVVLTFTIPALAFLGALWRRSARSSANWTRSAINND